MSTGAPGPDLVLPAAVLRVWGSEAMHLALASEAEQETELRLLDPGLVALLPGPGRPAVLDQALALGRRLIEGGSSAQPRQGHALMALARLRVGARVERVEEEIFTLLDGGPPTLPPGRVLASAHATYGFERLYPARSAGSLNLPSGRLLPIYTIGASDPEAPPWRNRSVLRRELRWVPRPELERELASALRSERLIRIAGPLGAGKTRLAATALASRGVQAHWHDATLGARRLPAVVRELGREAKAPRWLVVDSLESAEPELWNELAELTRRPDLAGLRWLLVGREPLPWPAELASTPAVVLPVLDAEFGAAIAKQLFGGLNLPGRVAERLLETTGGNPFAIEESLIAMARGHQLRQVLGNFFYREGAELTKLVPTQRFALHVEAELGRLGSTTAARALATSTESIPADDLRAAALASGADTGLAGWEQPYLAAGLLVARPGPWGEGVAWATPALRLTVESSLQPESRRALAVHLGTALAAHGGGAAQNWSAYPLLAKTGAGARMLLAASGASWGSSGASREELLAALLVELRAARAAKPRDPSLELDLLWALLPLGRRLGRLHELGEMIDRAVLLAEDRNPDRLLAFAAVQAELHRNAGKLAEAEAVLKRALAAARGADERRQGPLLLELARLMAQRDRPDEARKLMTGTLAAAERAGRPGLAASCRFQLGNLALASHELDEAGELHEQALEARRSAAIPAAIVQSLTALGAVARQGGNYPKALERFLEARELAVARGLDREEAYAQLGVGEVLSRLGDDLGAAQAVRRALALREGRDDSLGEAIARLAVAANHLRLEQIDLALKEARRAHFALNLLPAGEVRADADQLLGRIALKQRQTADAAAHLSEAARLHRAAGENMAVLADLGLALKAALVAGDVDRVERAFGALVGERERWERVAADELLQFDLFQGARWLAARGVEAPDPLPHLHRAYQELLRKTSFLEPALRQRFLFQVPEHQAIIDAATSQRLPLPAI